MAKTQVSGNLAVIAFWRGDRGYEQARRGEMWNDRRNSLRNSSRAFR